jgi:hypothetical protein
VLATKIMEMWTFRFLQGAAYFTASSCNILSVIRNIVTILRVWKCLITWHMHQCRHSSWLSNFLRSTARSTTDRPPTDQIETRTWWPQYAALAIVSQSTDVCLASAAMDLLSSKSLIAIQTDVTVYDFEVNVSAIS